MTTFKTGNPIGSTDARDRFDNTQNLDYLVLGPLDYYPDRLGVLRQSWAGMEQAFIGSEAERAAAFQAFLESSGWSTLGAYASGISIISHTQTVDYQGQPYQLKPSVPASIDSPYVTTGDWATEGVNFKLVGDNSLRQDLSSQVDLGMGAAMLGRSIQTVKSIAELRLLSSSGASKSAFALGHTNLMLGGGLYTVDTADTTSADNNATIIVGADGGRWKLKYSTDLDIAQAGALPGQDVAGKINTLAEVLYLRGGGTVRVNGEYNIGSTVKMFPNVSILGGGQGRTTRLNMTVSGIAFDTFKPVGYAAPLCIGSKVSGFTVVGKIVGGEKTGTCFSLRDCYGCEVSGNEVANFNTGLAWNMGSSATTFGQAYLNKVYQNSFKPCTIGMSFDGAANRNTIDTNNYADNLVAYDFSATYNYSETNTFITENIEGCHTWAEWGAAVYSQTWIGICIENPTSNGFTCTVKDPGRQVFVNLSLIPLGNPAAISKYDLVHGVTSMVLGSAASSGSERLGFSVNEDLNLYGVFTQFKHHASQTYAGTIAAGATTTISIPLVDAAINDRVEAYALRTLNGCSLQAYAAAGSVTVNIINGTSSSITIATTEISVILKRVG